MQSQHRKPCLLIFEISYKTLLFVLSFHHITLTIFLQYFLSFCEYFAFLVGFWGSAFKKFFALFLAKKKAPHKAVPFLTFIHWEILIIFIIPKTENIFNMHFRPIFAPISRLFISLDRINRQKKENALSQAAEGQRKHFLIQLLKVEFFKP
nr:MAG TPA: hypothetical protein [Caudoviricetes sp.]